MTQHEALALGRSLLNKHGLFCWAFKLNTNKRRAGVCKYRLGRIEVSVHHLKDGVEKVTDTILHEIAHALVGPDHGHNNVWRQKALEIGCNGKRCYDANDGIMQVEHAFVGTCPNCHTTVRRHRRKKIACRRCCTAHAGGRFDARFVFVWSANA